MELGQIIGLAGFTLAIAGWVWKVQASTNQQRSRVYERMDQKFELFGSLLKTEYVRKDVHDLINHQHEAEIAQIKQDLHAIKVSVDAIGKNVSILVSNSKKED